MQALDFNALQQPTWPITLKDDDKTQINLTVPSVDFVDRITAMAPQLKAAAKSKDGRAIQAAYALIAEIMSCNDDGYTFTAEELRDHYHMSFLDLLVFVKCYMEFVEEIKEAKN